MVIISSNPLARNQLLTRGKVYTFRKGKLRKKIEIGWASTMRGEPKIADITITPIMHVKPNRLEGALRPLVPFSGFDSVREWLEEIYKSYGELPEGWIYRVERRELVNFARVKI